MTPDRWRQVTAIFHAARERGPAERAAFLDEACRHDQSLRAEVEALLAAPADTRDLPSVALTIERPPQLSAGTAVGPYLVESLGSGGMGEVYKARDTRLGRSVAIKIISPDWAADGAARERFAREARAIAALNHPNICVLHDVGETTLPGAPPGVTVQYLVMELLNGETLAARVAKGRLPVAEALRYAVQIASALDTAHRAGFIHRDLKPANVILTSSGAKVLDFGLAKPRSDVRKDLTQTGAIVGTPAYMAPEQLRGHPADERADVFAFGAVLYEMLSGRALSRSGAAALATSQTPLPPALARVVMKCLADDPDDRWQSVADLRSELEWISRADEAALASPRAGLSRSRLAWSILVALAAVVALVWAIGRRWSPLESATTAKHLNALLPGRGPESFALSPDGNLLAYVQQTDDILNLFLMTLADGTSRALPGTGHSVREAIAPFFSPDANWVGFVQDSQLKKVAIAGGPPVPICGVVASRGASWGDAGEIVVSSESVLWHVPESGGTPVRLTTLAAGEVAHGEPRVLPGGKLALFAVSSGGTTSTAIEAVAIPGGARHLLVRGASRARYSSTGHLLYLRQPDLFAQSFDPERPSLSGAEVRALADVGAFDLSRDGMLVYRPRSAAARKIVRVDRQGNATPLPMPPRAYAHPSLLPDGSELVLEIEETPQHSLWRCDIRSGALTALTREGDHRPVLSPSGDFMIFSSERKMPRNLYRQSTDGSGDAQHLLESTQMLNASAWSADGHWLAFTESRADTRSDIWVLPLGDGGDRRPRPFRNTSAHEQAGVFSPNSRWMAFASGESPSQLEIIVAAFPGPGPQLQVSTGGGDMPVFSKDGHQLFYRHGDQVLVVDMTTEPRLSFSAPHVAFEIPGAKVDNALPFPVTRNGEAIYYVKVLPDADSGRSLMVIVNWFEELRRAMAK